MNGDWFWLVVGGGDKGGIVVRDGPDTAASTLLLERLCTGALVREIALENGRLQCRCVWGKGPATGWVSIAITDKVLLTRVDNVEATIRDGKLWEVVGGGDKGGIIARAGQDTSSELLPERLSTGALVKELALMEGRLYYERLTGAGPSKGWVSVRIPDKILVAKASIEIDEMFNSMRSKRGALAPEEPLRPKTSNDDVSIGSPTLASVRDSPASKAESKGIRPSPRADKADKAKKELEPDASTAGRKHKDGNDSKDAGGLRLYCPLSHFWEDVPNDMWPRLKNNSEVHIKNGANILFADEKSGSLMWTPWMTRSRGYRAVFVFHIERRTLPGMDSCSGADDDGSVGPAFALRNGTGRYLVVGGMLDGHCMQVKRCRAEAAALFTFVTLFPGGSPPPQDAASTGAANTGDAEEYACALLLVNENKMLKLRSDGYVSTVGASDVDSLDRNQKMAFSIEYLLPRASYDIEVEEEHIGIVVSRDLPLRVVAIRDVPKTDGTGSKKGLAERCGRIHTGDRITCIDDQNISGVPCHDVVAMITCKRPVTITFTVGPDVGSGTASSTATVPQREQPQPQKKPGFNLFRTRQKAPDPPSKGTDAVRNTGAGTVDL